MHFEFCILYFVFCDFILYLIFHVLYSVMVLSNLFCKLRLLSKLNLFQRASAFRWWDPSSLTHTWHSLLLMTFFALNEILRYLEILRHQWDSLLSMRFFAIDEILHYQCDSSPSMRFFATDEILCWQWDPLLKSIDWFISRPKLI